MMTYLKPMTYETNDDVIETDSNYVVRRDVWRGMEEWHLARQGKVLSGLVLVLVLLFAVADSSSLCLDLSSLV